MVSFSVVVLCGTYVFVVSGFAFFNGIVSFVMMYSWLNRISVRFVVFLIFCCLVRNVLYLLIVLVRIVFIDSE